ncbi:MAG: efflux RND transporter periplasmic adaptor subunit [Flavobacteriaceae bacterium]|nr:efflux RND transporter periplasmic adaptor subunit [Flavobacteriaceae bacterium]
MKNIIKITIALLLITIVSCERKETTKEIKETVSIKAPIATVGSNSTQGFTTSSGKIVAANSATISTRTMGFVSKFTLKPGDKVRKGQILIQLNSSDIDAKKAQVAASILEATASLKNSQINYNRYTTLFKSNSASQKEMDDISVQYSIAKARLSSIKAKESEINALRAYSTIRAPFTGVITNTYIEQGDMASPGKPLIDMENQHNYEVNTMVSEHIIGKIAKDMNVEVLLKSNPEILKGLVSEISTSSNNTGGQYLVKIKLVSSIKNVFSGMYVSIQFPISSEKEEQNSVLIPRSALVKKGELLGVYTLNKDNIALLRWLRVGRIYGENIQILSGLSQGESYVLSAELPIYNGVKILIKQ